MKKTKVVHDGAMHLKRGKCTPVPYLQSRPELEQSKFKKTFRAGSESDQVTFLRLTE